VTNRLKYQVPTARVASVCGKLIGGRRIYGVYRTQQLQLQQQLRHVLVATPTTIAPEHRHFLLE